MSNFVELVYSLIENRSIEYGNVKVNEFASYLGAIFGIDVKDASDTYTSTIKKRKSDSRTTFLDRLGYVFNRKMDIEDGIDVQEPPPDGVNRNLHNK